MAVIEELIRKEEDGSISFGNYMLDTKTKLSDFEYQGDTYKVKTFKEITKLEKNGLFLYESVLGTAVTGFMMTEDSVSFSVEGEGDAQIIIGLEPETYYKVTVEDEEADVIKTNLGGKLVISIALEPMQIRDVMIEKEE